MSQAVNEADFDSEVLASTTPVLVDFWADWCGPCHALAAQLESVEQALGDRLKVAKVDVDQNMPLAQRFGVRALPTLLLVAHGEVVSQQSGALSASELQSWLEPLLAQHASAARGTA